MDGKTAGMDFSKGPDGLNAGGLSAHIVAPSPFFLAICALRLLSPP